MKTTSNNKTSRNLRQHFWSLVAMTFLMLSGSVARASVAYGSINNFDTVNDTSNVCRGFEIELDDIHTTDITYTFDYNHYGTPKITEQSFTDTNNVVHTNVIVRYQAVWTNTGWSAYTAIPTNNIPPTAGHAFTNPSLNFGGEHFGLGYRNSPTKVLYHWLLDDGSHNLVLGPSVNVSTPVFTAQQYVPAGQPVAVVPVIPAPVLPPIPTLADPLFNYEFSDATWVKVITTTSHTNNPIALRELVTPDTNNPSAKDWRNGETNIEVETAWQLLQTDFNQANPTNGVGGANGQLVSTKTNSLASDDVVTYRYEYYAYVGPYADWDTHEALAQTVTNGIYGVGIITNNGVEIDLSTNPIVGKYLGAQMSAMVATPPIGLIDHLPDAEKDTLYPTRCFVISANTNFTATCSGLPNGMTFEADKGWIGNTPTVSGVFIVTVTVSSSNSPVLTKKYPLLVVEPGANPPPHSAVDTSVSQPNAGATTGDNIYTNGNTATVTVTLNAGYGFANWTDNGVIVSSLASYTFTNTLNRSLVANFVPRLSFAAPQPHSLTIIWLTNFSGYSLQQNSNLRMTNWFTAAEAIITNGGNYQATITMTNGPRFFRLMHP